MKTTENTTTKETVKMEIANLSKSQLVMIQRVTKAVYGNHGERYELAEIEIDDCGSFVSLSFTMKYNGVTGELSLADTYYHVMITKRGAVRYTVSGMSTNGKKGNKIRFNWSNDYIFFE